MAKSLKSLNPSSDVQQPSLKQAEAQKDQESKAASEAKCMDSKKQDLKSCDKKEVEEKAEKPPKVEKTSKKIPIFQPIKKLIVKKKKPSVPSSDSEIINKLPSVDGLDSLEVTSNSSEKKKKKKNNLFKKCDLLAQ